MTLDWATSSSKHLVLALLVTSGCGDDGGTAGDGPGSTSAATTMNGAASSESGSPGTSEGGTAAATSTGNGTGDASLGTTATGDTAGATTAGATTDGTTGGSQGVEVGSCDECSAEELCMQLTEHAGPADGGGPNVTLYCFAYPATCGEALDCRCAGHLCPVPERGSEAWCETGAGILYCSVAYP